jgi:type II secretory pathway component GspD/PulD (secretin)
MRKNLRLSGFFMVFLLSILVPRLNAETGLSSILDSDRTVSMDLQEANLKDVLKIFSIQSGLNFISSDAVKDRKITLYLENVPIQMAMEKIFSANKLNYNYDEAAGIFTVNYADDPANPDMLTKIYQLKYRSVSSANLEKEKINLFSGASVTSGVTGSGTGTGPGSSPAPTASSLFETLKQLLSKTGKITEDSKTNSVIITDVASRFAVFDEIIARLDIPQPQVMLEVEMLDVSKDVVDQMGFNVGSSSSSSPFTFILGSSLANSRGFIGDLTKRKANIDTAGVAGNVVMGNALALVLDYLNQQADTKYLARPRILTLNNETAEIGITKDEIVSATRTTETASSGTTTTSTTYVRATELKLTPEGVGIFLRVTPQINMDTGEINLVVNPKTSSTVKSPVVTSNTEIAYDPEVRSTKSIIKVFDGETVVLGGLIHQEKQETDTKLPLLGDIPVMGALFRHKSVDKNLERELLVFITPRIMKERGFKVAQSGKPAVTDFAYSDAQPATSPDRKQTIVDMLNTFERERNKR